MLGTRSGRILVLCPESREMGEVIPAQRTGGGARAGNALGGSAALSSENKFFS